MNHQALFNYVEAVIRQFLVGETKFSRKKSGQRCIAITLALFIAATAPASADTAEVSASYADDHALTVRMDAGNGDYRVRQSHPAWSFNGGIGEPLTNLKSASGSDSLGAYDEISFAWTNGATPMDGSIRLYANSPVILFTETCDAATEMPPAPFPSFTGTPRRLHVFSYQEKTFSPPHFAASDCSTPWLIFNDADDAMVVSPASHYMIAAMSGDGRNKIASGLNSALRHLPAGFSQQTIMVFGHGINRAWDLWGKSLQSLRGVQRPDNEADTVLRYLGYWTDNFAFYYYNYDLDKGYAGTLQSLVDRYRREQIPLHYLQLDSWWYSKSFNGPDGAVGTTKAPRLPEGEWNRYGGLLEYRAHPALFPNGLGAFQQSVDLPLVTHNRWIDPASPYHQNYKISGVAAVDQNWWNDIGDYLKTNGVITYEQDWLDRIYEYSPEFRSTVDTGETFLDDMSRAFMARKMTMQYCMPYPCHFLQGSAYPNLTTIRVSDDGFCPDRYNNFLYVSRLASAMGIWPWADVYRSAETNNVLLSTLSAGPVGIGDEIGRENTNNLFKAVRADGVIVKPDVPAMPLDQCYIADARHASTPIVAAAYTDHDGLRTAYVFAFNRSKAGDEQLSFTPAELGFDQPVVVYDYFAGAGRRLKSGESFPASMAAGGAAFYIVAPVGKSGIAFLGDKGKFVSTGKERIISLDDEKKGLTAKILFAPSESSVVLYGYVDHRPKVNAQSGRAHFLHYDAATGYFEIKAAPAPTAPFERINGDSVREMELTLKIN
ncbi:MAG TPA: hypothetical protein VGY98_13970 [Verrucomicrobiae bacterium]|nr:hypothetical protein [Verrucomicrobiae bacterium]